MRPWTVRGENERLENRCIEFEDKIRVRDERQDQTDERLDERQRMITQLEQDPANVAQQAAYLSNHIGGLPKQVSVTKQGRQ